MVVPEGKDSANSLPVTRNSEEWGIRRLIRGRISWSHTVIPLSNECLSSGERGWVGAREGEASDINVASSFSPLGKGWRRADESSSCEDDGGDLEEHF